MEESSPVVATGVALDINTGLPKKKTTRIKKSKTSSTAGDVVIPTNVVCTARSANSIELGLILSMLVLSLYMFACLSSMFALPNVTFYRPWSKHLGENLNLARDEWTEQYLKAQEFKNEISALDAVDIGVAGNEEEQEKPKPVVAVVQPSQRENLRKPQQVSGVVKVPESKWPVSIRNEGESTYETLIHPGDKKTVMSMPRFWSPPIHNGGLMSRETAMKVGSCVKPDPITNSHVRGDACPPEDRTIFIGIASYRDFQCRFTVESAFSRAKYPERIRVGVVDQLVEGEDHVCNDPIEPCDKKPEQALCKYRDQVDVYKMKAELSIGPVFARHIGYRLYRGEYYATQSDAHVTFTQNWDTDIISQLESTKNEMAVLSTYLTDVQGSIDEKGNSKRNTRPIMCNTYYEGGGQGMHLRHGSQPEREPYIQGVPQLQPWWAAGYSFSRGHFIVNVPYDPYQPMIFQGEEMSIGIRGFTVGYDYYAPERSVCFHHYAVGKNAAIRNKVHHFWDNSNRYAGIGRSAMQRLLGIVHMNPEIDVKEWDHTDEATYGLGGVRTPEKFYNIYGIDVVKKKTEPHLCRFVQDGGKMHHKFMPYLRPDGMGIDYNKIDYRFKDPNPEEVEVQM